MLTSESNASQEHEGIFPQMFSRLFNQISFPVSVTYYIFSLSHTQRHKGTQNNGTNEIQESTVIQY